MVGVSTRPQEPDYLWEAIYRDRTSRVVQVDHKYDRVHVYVNVIYK